MRVINVFLGIAVLLILGAPLYAGPVMESLEDEVTLLVDQAVPAVVSVRSESVARSPLAVLSHAELPPWVCQILDNRVADPLRASGSGFFIDPSGLVLTTEHVVRGAPRVELVLADGRVLPAQVLGADRDFNVALLQVEKEGKYPFLKAGDASRVRPGSWAIGIGNPYGLVSSVSWGLISGVRRNGLGTALFEDLIQVTAPVNPGDSGGPLLNSKGEVIGIITAGLSGYQKDDSWPFPRRQTRAFSAASAQGIGFAIPMGLAQEVVDRIRQNPDSQRGWIGVRLGDVSPWACLQLGLPRGALVLDVMDGSPAQKAGLTSEDIIVSYQGIPVKDCFALKKELLFTSAGQEISLKVFREGKDVDVELVTAPPSPGRKHGEVKE